MSIKALFQCGVALILGVGSIRAQEATLGPSSVLQSGVRDDLGTGESALVNQLAEPFTFANSESLISISSISFTLTLLDGDTGPGVDQIYGTSDDDPFVGTLFLRLDGIDTGIVLNGLDSDAGGAPTAIDFVNGTATFSGTPLNAALILAALQGDGELIASVYSTAGNPDNTIGGNLVTIPRMDLNNADILTTLSITGTIPEPSTWALFAGGLLIIGFTRYKRVGGIASLMSPALPRLPKQLKSRLPGSFSFRPSSSRTLL